MKFRFIILSLALMTMSGYGYDRITGEQFASRSEWDGCNQSSSGNTNRY